MIDSSWKMPEWMKPMEGYFQDRGALSVEAIMSTYGAKNAARLAQADVDLRATLVNAQVGLLVALKAAGMLAEAPQIVVGKMPEMKK